MKTITTGTEITFTKTGEKHTLTQTDTGFDVKLVKLSKNIPSEPYSFQELLDLYEAGQITISGFEEADAPLVRSIITNYMHSTTLKDALVKIHNLEKNVEQLTNTNEELTYEKRELEVMNKNLSDKVELLNKALEAMNEAEPAN